MITPDFHMLITKSARDMADTMDTKILEFFGSEELVREYAHLFVMESHPVQITPYIATNVSQNTVGYYMQTDFTIRPKTMAELEAEKNEQ